LSGARSGQNQFPPAANRRSRGGSETVTPSIHLPHHHDAKRAEKWDKTEDKPAAVLIATGGVLALSLGLTVVSFVDKIPIGALH